MIKFSIITVCLNAGNDLLETVKATLEQTYSNFEIIVKDGLSADGSIEKLPQDPKIRLIRKNDTGIYDAMNQGIEEASGDYLIFMNAGDRFYGTDTLEKIAEAMGPGGDTLYYGRCYNETLKCYSNSPKRLTKFFCYRSMICHQAMLFERKYLQEKKYNTQYRVSADRELLLHTVCKVNAKTMYLPLIIASYKGSGFCEAEVNRQKILNENKKMQQEFFAKSEQTWYGFLHAATLPGVRKRLAAGPKTVKVYKKLIGLLYGNK